MKWDERGMDTLHDEHNIKGFFGDYRWLSNFHPCFCKYESFIYFSSEGAYQAAKTTDELIRVKFISMNPVETKKEGRRLQVRTDWESIKVKVMTEILMDKFTRNIDLNKKLIETGSKYLEETNWWNDRFWGVCKGVGENNLGKILMTVRAAISSDTGNPVTPDKTIKSII